MLPVYYFLLQPLSPIFYILLVGGLFWIGIKICGRAAKDLKQADPSYIVWDEMVGILAALVMQPAGLYSLIIAFLLFRFFDILKPWPISWVDKQVHGGLGIMLDDIMAGGVTAGLLYCGDLVGSLLTRYSLKL